VVDLEDAELRAGRGPEAEGIEPCAQQHVLADPAVRGLGDPVLGVPAPADYLRAGARKDGVAAMLAVISDELDGSIAEQHSGDCVFEDEWRMVDDQMGGAGGCRSQGGATWR
jgi:hypothetical protein